LCRWKVTGAYVRLCKNKLLSIDTYYGPLITLCISIMGSFKQNHSLSNFSVTENSKKYSINRTNQ